MIYWLTGAIGAGKTTLGAALAGSQPDTLFIDGDYLLPDADSYPFEERVTKTVELLISRVNELSGQDQSAVIVYPINANTAQKLKSSLKAVIIIGVQIPTNDLGTRGYSDWEQKRRLEMAAVSGQGFADIIFEHPSTYLHDSLAALRAKLKL